MHFYSIALTSLEGKANLLAYKWASNDLMFKYYVELREEVSKEIREKPGVWFRVAPAQTELRPTSMILLLSVSTYSV